ncbi:PqiA/YebS family transporter subunit [Marinomonas epiphytica]
MLQETTLVCDECDWVNSVPPLVRGERLKCQRCDHVLISLHKHAKARIFGFSLSAMLMLAMSFLFPFLGFSSNGAEREMSLFDVISILLLDNFLLLGSLVCLLLIVLPVLYLVCVFQLSWSLKWRRKVPFVQRYLARWFIVIEPWLMADVFLVGVLVALVKLTSLADVQLGLSFWAFCGYVVLLVKTVSVVDRKWFWHQVAGPGPRYKHFLPASARQQGLLGCHFCGATLPQSAKYCTRCGHSVHSRRPKSLQKTLAYLIASLVMYVPANVFPIMETTFLGVTEPSTIMGGVLLLWSIGSYPVALIIFLASVVIPLAKILSLAWLCWQCHSSTERSTQSKMKLYRLTELVGRWSMIDIFVVAVLASLVQLGNLMSIQPGIAAMSFATVVIFTMMAAMVFDPRLIWDKDETKRILSQEKQLG